MPYLDYAVYTITFTTAGEVLNDQDQNVSAYGRLEAAYGTEGFQRDSFAMQGFSVWMDRFGSRLQWDWQIAQWQINFLDNSGLGGSANAQTFAITQTWLVGAYDALQEITTS